MPLRRKASQIKAVRQHCERQRAGADIAFTPLRAQGLPPPVPPSSPGICAGLGHPSLSSSFVYKEPCDVTK